jgi:uncharacterized protein YbjT (DUF2867 family)
MSDKMVIAIVGSTGAQGGGLARAILADPDGEFAARALTRDPSKEQAVALAAAGAEVVQADLDDEESLRKAFGGAYGVFAMTNFWEHFSPEKEVAQAGNAARAAKDAGVEHLVWSTLEDVRTCVPLDDDRMPTLQEKYKVPHFDGKGEADAVFADAGVPTTFLFPSWYFENMIFFGQGPARGEDGAIAFTLPLGDKKMAGIAAEDIGKCTLAIFKQGTELVGERIGVAGDQLSGAEMAAAFSKAFGEEVAYRPMTFDQYRALGFPGADDMGNMYQFYAEFDNVVNSVRDVERSRSLNPDLQSLETWLAANKGRIPLAVGG